MFRTSLVLLFAAIVSAQTRPNHVVPNFPDLTIKIRKTDGLMQPQITTWFLKGPRQRIERKTDSAGFSDPMSIEILQCDQRTEYILRPNTKTYSKFVRSERELSRSQLPSLRERMEREETAPAEDGPDVIVTVDSVDTGERRQMGSYEARHVKTTITVEPSKDAAARPGRTEIDGWYIDLMGLVCLDRDLFDPAADLGAVNGFHTGVSHDHVIKRVLGTARRGFAVEQKATQKQSGNVFIATTELIECSEKPLDPSLFELPTGYKLNKPTRQRSRPVVISPGRRER